MASQALEKEIGHGNAGLLPWSAFSDVTEPVPELAWPHLQRDADRRADHLRTDHLLFCRSTDDLGKRFVIDFRKLI
jgi:hypothetical protein